MAILMMRNQREFVVAVLCLSLAIGCKAGYADPPAGLQSDDLLGTWEVGYGNDAVDKLILRGDGTFKQLFIQPAQDYVFQTEGNTWWIEQIPSGEVRVHLSGARYYSAGIRIAEHGGMGDPCPADLPACGWDKLPRYFLDPFVGAPVEMVDKLVLSVRLDTAGDLLMHHMWIDRDRGFALIGGESEIFRRANIP